MRTDRPPWQATELEKAIPPKKMEWEAGPVWKEQR